MGLRAPQLETFRALCEALFPEGGALPAAERPGGVAVAEPVAAYLEHAPRRVRAAVRLALVLLERTGARGRRFSRLPLARREAAVRRLAASRIGLRRDLLLLLKMLACVGYARDGRVTGTLGVRARCEPAPGAEPPGPPAVPLDPEALVPPSGVERCDVVVVGSGAGGAAAARALAERGLDTVVLEEGPYLDARTYPRDPLEALPALYRDAGLTICEGRPAIPLPTGRCVGGTTVINSGTCFRTPPDLLRRWRDELGIGWATDLEGEFEALWRDLEVRAVDPATAGRNAELCRAGAEAIGAENGPLERNAGSIACCGTCPTGCALDAKRAMHVSELPRAVAAGARVRAGARVERVLVEGGRAVGVACATGSNGGGGASGEPYEVRARAVVLAAGALGTPALLLRQGLANGSGELGRHLHIHPACWVGALYEEEVRGWDGVMQSWHVGEWADRGLFLEATFTPLAFSAPWLRGAGAELKGRIERFGRLGVIGVHLAERASEGRVRPAGRRARVRYRLSNADAETLRFGIARAADIHFAAGAIEAYPQVGRLGAIRPGDQRALVEDARVPPRDLRLEAFHPMGTARMGADSRSSVVAPTGEAHGVPGLYVADASLLPTALGVNPMITIMACARRVAAGLAERLA